MLDVAGRYTALGFHTFYRQISIWIMSLRRDASVCVNPTSGSSVPTRRSEQGGRATSDQPQTGTFTLENLLIVGETKQHMVGLHQTASDPEGNTFTPVMTT